MTEHPFATTKLVYRAKRKWKQKFNLPVLPTLNWADEVDSDLFALLISFIFFHSGAAPAKSGYFPQKRKYLYEKLLE